ncbi:hypothetical protein QSJ19_13205 [Gordonia sp. ABSL11-1]|nr:hypothetical protein [Gordonia sp. ABSL11-1]MDL9946533.1 hypothetical protein [Gordonia sp. ABSL11-1]
MAICDVCGNDDDHSMTITINRDDRDVHGTFDSFECAITALAPLCAHCGCRVMGHGVAIGSALYCCAHCGQQVDDVVVAHGAAVRERRATSVSGTLVEDGQGRTPG